MPFAPSDPHTRPSLQFTDHGSITITIQEIEALPGVSITVADTGRGMSGEAHLWPLLHLSLFDPTTRLQKASSEMSSLFPSARPITLAQVRILPFIEPLGDRFDLFADRYNTTGAGLGVSISDAIVRRMHGTLHFASERGSGTQATISLPLLLLATTAPRPKRPAPSLSGELSALFAPLTIKEQGLQAHQRGATAPRPIDISPPHRPHDSALTDGKQVDAFRVLIADDNPIAR